MITSNRSTLSPTVHGHFLREKFFRFLFGYSLKNSQIYSALKPEVFLVRWRPSGGDKVFNVEAEGRQKVEDCRQKHLVDEEKISLLEALGLGLFPWRLLGLFSWLEKLWALFPWFFGLRWALHSRNFLAARRFLGSIKPMLWHFPEKRKARPCQSWALQQGTLF